MAMTKREVYIHNMSERRLNREIAQMKAIIWGTRLLCVAGQSIYVLPFVYGAGFWTLSIIFSLTAIGCAHLYNLYNMDALLDLQDEVDDRAETKHLRALEALGMSVPNGAM